MKIYTDILRELKFRGGKKVKVRALFTGFDLTEGKIYEVIFEYDTVYELRCDTGTYCRNKNFFEVVEEQTVAEAKKTEGSI